MREQLNNEEFVEQKINYTARAKYLSSKLRRSLFHIFIVIKYSCERTCYLQNSWNEKSMLCTLTIKIAKNNVSENSL